MNNVYLDLRHRVSVVAKPRQDILSPFYRSYMVAIRRPNFATRKKSYSFFVWCGVSKGPTTKG